MNPTDVHSDCIEIDGSQGEGGGQIVRSSLALALLTGRPARIRDIRAGRKKPGLMRQHLTAVQAAVELCRGKVQGAEIGSRSLVFEPGGVCAGEYRFSVGTAGSATLVLQTVLPALLIADGSAQITLEGGTHNPWAPPFDFLERAFLPLVSRMGPRITARLERHGFHPAGGGRFVVAIEPAKVLNGFDLLERGEIRSRSVRVLLSNLPGHIGEREIATVLERLNWSEECGRIEHVAAQGPGNVVFAVLESEHVTEVFTGFGRVGIRAEEVAAGVADEVCDYLKHGVPVGPHLADQFMLPLGISAWQSRNESQRHGGSFRTVPLTRHSQTHIDILRQFLGVTINTERSPDGSCTVHVAP